jgi:hypothetical protein
MQNNRAYYRHQPRSESNNLLTLDKKYYDRVTSVHNLIVNTESIDILLLCPNILSITILLPDAHPVLRDSKYYNNTITALLPSILLIRYKLDIILVDKNNDELYIWNNNNINSYFIHNDTIKIYYFKYGLINYDFKCYKIITTSTIECEPINNLHKMLIKLVLDNSIYPWVNLNYGLKKLVTLTNQLNNKTPYKCKVKLYKSQEIF